MMSSLMRCDLNISAALVLLAALTALQSSQTVTIDLTPQDKSTLHPYQYRISSAVAERQLVNRVEPEYPVELKQTGASGEVMVRLVIDQQGNTAGVISHSDVDPRISEAAVRAVKQWRFRPYLLNGHPVEVETQVSLPFNFGPQSPASSPSPTPVKRLRISQGVAEGNIISKEPPRYPLEARKKRLTGDVVLGLVIDRTGEVTDLTVVSGNPILAQSALEAVQQWKYRPFLLNGEPVEVETTAKIIFRM